MPDREAADDPHEDVRQALLSAILAATDQIKGKESGNARTILSLAEAYAWVSNPDQPHGTAHGA